MLLLLVALLAPAAGRVFERCELARELRHQYGLPDEHIATWVCIARHESEYNTSAVNPGSGDHGLFQISELWWCGAGAEPGGACGLRCSSLRDADLSDDVQCALRVHREHTHLSGDGFNAWVVYPQHCRHGVEAYTKGCFTRDNSLVTYEYDATTTSSPTTHAKTSLLHHKLTTQKSRPSTNIRPPQTRNNIFSREIHKTQHQFIEHPTGSRYKYNINKSGFALFKEN